MTHRDISRRINQDLDDLKVRNPRAYGGIEKRLRRLELDASFAVSQSPVTLGLPEEAKGTRSMERMK